MLARREGEKVMIGDDISIEIVDLDAGQVKLGFEAPAHVKIHRLEVWRALRRRGPPDPDELGRP